jgi:hypothetical protein
MWLGNKTVDFRTPYYSKKDPSTGKRIYRTYEELTKEFDAPFSRTLNSRTKGSLLELIRDMEIGQDGKSGQRAKIGSKSLHLPWPNDGPKKVDALFATKRVKESFALSAWEAAIKRTSQLLPSNSVEITGFEEAMRGVDGTFGQGGLDEDGMDISTNSGSPMYIGPWRPTANTDPKIRKEVEIAYAYILDRAQHAMTRLKRGETIDWVAIAGQRLVSAGIDWAESEKKKRLIIAVEKAEPLIWKTFTPGLYDALRPVCHNGIPIFLAWSDPVVIDYFMQVALDRAHSHGGVILSGDVSGFDQSVNPDLFAYLGPVLDNWLKSSTRLGTGLINSMSRTTSVITPGRIYPPGPMGMLSGSGGTNLGDSLYNLTVLYYGEAKGYYKIDFVSVQGDDFLVFGEGVTPEAIAKTYEEVGMSAHPDKQLFAPDAASFLQKLHYRGMIGGIASVYRTLSSALTYERMSFGGDEWNPYVDIVRTISQLENTVFHPCFEELVSFMKRGDKYRLGEGKPALWIMKQAGETGQKVIARDFAASWKSGHDPKDFGKLVVNGVIRGEKLPPLGSKERWSRAYSDRVSKVEDLKSRLRNVA